MELRWATAQTCLGAIDITLSPALRARDINPHKPLPRFAAVFRRHIYLLMVTVPFMPGRRVLPTGRVMRTSK